MHAFLKAGCVLLLAYVAKTNLKPVVLPIELRVLSPHAQRLRRDLPCGKGAFGFFVWTSVLCDQCLDVLSASKTCHDAKFGKHTIRVL